MVRDARKEWQLALGKRFEEERKRAKLTLQNIADQLKLSKAVVNHWALGRSEVTSFDLGRLQQLGLDASFILLGAREGKGGVKMRFPDSMIPHPTSAEILAIAQGRLDPQDVVRRRPTFSDVADGMAFDIVDRGMEPEYRPGSTIVTIDRKRAPEPGDLVLTVLLASSETLFRRYRPGAESKPGHPPFTLVASNPDLEPRMIVPMHQPVLLGVMVERAHLGSR